MPAVGRPSAERPARPLVMAALRDDAAALADAEQAVGDGADLLELGPDATVPTVAALGDRFGVPVAVAVGPGDGDGVGRARELLAARASMLHVDRAELCQPILDLALETGAALVITLGRDIAVPDLCAALVAIDRRAAGAGLHGDRLVVDIGLGTGRPACDRLALIRAPGQLAALGRPVLASVDGLAGMAVAVAMGCGIVRVPVAGVRAARRVCDTMAAIREAT